MSVQLFPALDGYDKYYFWEPSRRSVDWKSVPHKLDELDGLAKRLEIAPLSSFMNVSRDDAPFDDETMDEFEQDGELIDGVWYYQERVLWSVEPQWFAPEQGLATVRSLFNHLGSQDEEAVAAGSEDLEQDYSGVMGELREMEKILNRAVQENKPFRLFLSA